MLNYLSGGVDEEDFGNTIEVGGTMKRNDILRVFICVSVFCTVPVSIAAVDSEKIQRVDSVFKTFKKDVGCLLSRRKKCTDEQKRRLIKQGLSLAALVGAVTGLVLSTKYLAMPAYRKSVREKSIMLVKNYAKNNSRRVKYLLSSLDLRHIEDNEILIELLDDAKIKIHTNNKATFEALMKLLSVDMRGEGDGYYWIVPSLILQYK